MKARFLAILTALVVIVFVAFGQSSLRGGETGLRLEVEGRGVILIRLNVEKAPKATAQIARLAKQGFYDGQRWFRVTKKPRPFLIQTGDPQSKDASKLESDKMGSQGSGSRIPYEDSGLPAKEGAVCLAAMPGDKDSGDSQFFILMGSYKFLEGEHTVFGEVVSGMEVVRQIEKGDRIVSARIVGG